MLMRIRFAIMALALVLSAALVGSAGAAAPGATFYQNAVLGVDLVRPATMRVVQDQYLSDSFGFTLTDHPLNAKDGDADEALWLRVSWLRHAAPGDLQAAAQKLVDSFPGVAIRRSEMTIAGNRALVLANAPGLVPTTYIYLAAGGRLYEIVYPKAALDAQGKAILATLRFHKPQKAIESLGLVQAEDAFYAAPAGARPVTLKGIVPAPAKVVPGPDAVTPQAIGGCVDYPTSKYLQTPFTSAANGNGYSQAGPSYYGEGLHTGCNDSTHQNDYYALDMPMRTWDPVLNPGNGGTVIWVGWASGGWSTLGRTVIIDQGNGYKSLAAHLVGINVSVGQAVNANSVIGWVGGSGNWTDGYWGSHLHQGLYLNANVSGGGTYGGQSAQMVKVFYCRFGCSNYYWYISNRQQLSW